MSTSVPNLNKLRTEQDRMLFEIKQLERDIETISDQLADSGQYEDIDRKVGSDWWYRARDAKRYKERERETRIARVNRIGRLLDKHPNEQDEQSKVVLKDVLRTLFHVAKAAARYYEDSSEGKGDRLASAIDRLDAHIPGWDVPQTSKGKSSMQTLRLVD